MGKNIPWQGVAFMEPLGWNPFDPYIQKCLYWGGFHAGNSPGCLMQALTKSALDF